ncbi:MAG: hypothetical protein HXS48_09330 [Theionarchaea archaeon]|nr:MAG: hypothetical protein AYK19_07540 [Theionarchaea archaeon DG-70-1]MBU7027133.1 hypothetical protein [Theionarchaea archaeon]
MKRSLCVLVLLVVGCFEQGVRGVYYVMVETEPFDKDEDGIQEGIMIFLVFRDRELEPVSFYDAECRVVVRVYGDGMVYEKEVLFDSSGLVGRQGGIVVLSEDVGVEYGDIVVVVTIEGRGEFHAEKKGVNFS